MTAVCGSDFACALFDRLPAGAGNVFFSPLSIGAALGLVYAGARSGTANEIREAAGFGSHAETAEAFATLLRTLAGRDARSDRAGAGPTGPEEGPDQELRIANCLWGAIGQLALEPFRQVVSSAYGAPFEQLDFAHDPEGSRTVVNRWVERATAGKIPELASRQNIDSSTRLVLANAAYLRANWSFPFWTEHTRPAPFYAPSGELTVPLMRQTGHLDYGETADAQVVEKTYGARHFVLRVAVPRDVDGLPGIERSTRALLTLPLTPRYVELHLPRFAGRTHLELGAALSALGLPSLFRYPDADLSGIDGTRDLYVSTAVHETFVRVDEQGTEAAAATMMFALAGGRPPKPPKPVTVRVDRPFLFWILDRPTGAVLFAGRVVEPKET
jgi:serpin B